MLVIVTRIGRLQVFARLVRAEPAEAADLPRPRVEEARPHRLPPQAQLVHAAQGGVSGRVGNGLNINYRQICVHGFCLVVY